MELKQYYQMLDITTAKLQAHSAYLTSSKLRETFHYGRTADDKDVLKLGLNKFIL
jgi:hypothetical protein